MFQRRKREVKSEKRYSFFKRFSRSDFGRWGKEITLQKSWFFFLLLCQMVYPRAILHAGNVWPGMYHYHSTQVTTNTFWLATLWCIIPVCSTLSKHFGVTNFGLANISSPSSPQKKQATTSTTGLTTGCCQTPDQMSENCITVYSTSNSSGCSSPQQKNYP